MRAYELMLILNPELEGEALASVVDKFQNLITENGGSVHNVDRWGKRRLAYEIDGHREGHYAVMDFTAEPPAVKELDRVLKLSDEVIRHLVVRKDEN